MNIMHLSHYKMETTHKARWAEHFTLIAASPSGRRSLQQTPLSGADTAQSYMPYMPLFRSRLPTHEGFCSSRLFTPASPPTTPPGMLNRWTSFLALQLPHITLKQRSSSPISNMWAQTANVITTNATVLHLTVYRRQYTLYRKIWILCKEDNTIISGTLFSVKINHVEIL